MVWPETFPASHRIQGCPGKSNWEILSGELHISQGSDLFHHPATLKVAQESSGSPCEISRLKSFVSSFPLTYLLSLMALSHIHFSEDVGFFSSFTFEKMWLGDHLQGGIAAELGPSLAHNSRAIPIGMIHLLEHSVPKMWVR